MRRVGPAHRPRGCVEGAALPLSSVYEAIGQEIMVAGRGEIILFHKDVKSLVTISENLL